MAIVRVLYGEGQDEDAIIRRIKLALLDDDVLSVVVHKPGSQFADADGHEYVIDGRGRMQPLNEAAAAAHARPA